MVAIIYIFAMIYSFIASLRIPTIFLWTLVLLALGNSLIQSQQNWGMYHYYVGAKYFHEVGYFDLYECTITEAIPRRDLHTYHYRVDTPDCTSTFTPERYEAFQQDIKSSGFYQQALIDKGYNGTPTWTAVFGGLANLGIITPDNAHVVDIIALVTMIFTSIYFLGWRKTAYIALMILTFYGTIYRIWGHYAQWVWLATAIIGVILLEKKQTDNCVGAFLIGISTSLAIFPVFLMLRYLSLRNLILFAVGLTTMLSVGIANGRDLDGYIEFIENMKIHSGFIGHELITGNMGLKQTITFTLNPSTEYHYCFTQWTDDCSHIYENAYSPALYMVTLPFLLTSPLGMMFGLLTLSSFYWLIFTVIPIWYSERWTRLWLFINVLMCIPLLFDHNLLAYRHWILYLYFVALGVAHVDLRKIIQVAVRTVQPRLHTAVTAWYARSGL